MNNKRLVITSTISLLLVAILLIGSTYAIFTSSEIDEKENVYTTGNLDITYTVSGDNKIMTDTTPISVEDSNTLIPYRIKVTNKGNVAYNFNIILTDTTASNKINYDYIMTQVGKLEPQALSSTTNNVLGNVTILPNTSVDIDVRVWLSDAIKNTESGKSFYAKLSIDGVAINTDETEIDNSDLIAIIEQRLSSVSAGSWVKYTGNNGCSGKACEGQNANYVSDTDMGYCRETNSKFKVNGWRLAYAQNDTPYLVSAGSTDCITITPTSTGSGYVENTSSSTNWTNSNDTYKFCKNYSFDSNTGKFALDTSDCKSVAATVMSGDTMYQGYKYSCNSNTETTCSTMYEFAYNFTSLSYKTHTAVAKGSTNFSSHNGIEHINSLNASALKYCNPTYAYKNLCNSDSAWNINATDFQMITGKALSNSSCYTKHEDTSCGYNNDLIDNGGYYWFANPYNSNSTNLLLWIGDSRMVDAFGQTYAYGARPVLRLDSKIVVTGGSGTYQDPYTIAVNDGSEPVQPTSVTVTYNTLGGNACSFPTKGVNIGSTYGDMCNPTRTGYTFQGWYTSETGGTKVESTTTVSNTSDHTLYARWTPAIYTVTLNNQSATTAGTSTIYYQYNTTKTVNGVTCYYYTDSSLSTCLSGGYTINKPTKKGYTFGGYFTATNGGGTQYVDTAGSFINSIYKTTGNKTLYAKWTANTYTINFNGNGSTGGSTASKTCTFGKDCSISSNGFTRTGYTFVGWTTNSNGTDDGYGWTGWSGTWYYVDGEYGVSNKTLTLYARWTVADCGYEKHDFSAQGSTLQNISSFTAGSTSTWTDWNGHSHNTGYVIYCRKCHKSAYWYDRENNWSTSNAQFICPNSPYCNPSTGTCTGGFVLYND